MISTSKSKRFDIVAARIRHAEAESKQHPIERIKRIEPRGMLIAQFFFALDQLKPRDRTRKEQGWQAKKARDEVLQTMRLQFEYVAFPRPLEGRPLVRCIRYSTTEPDAMAGWAKVAVDCLQPGGVRTKKRAVAHPYGHTVSISKQVPFGGLGIIRNDRPSDCEVVEWWEPAKRNQGFCVVEVWTG